MTHGSKNYKTVGKDHEFEKGDRFQQIYVIDFPGWMPGSKRDDMIEKLLDHATNIQNALNNRLPGSNKVEIVNTDLHDQGDGKYLYVVTGEVKQVDESEPVTAAGVWAIIYAVLAALLIIGIGFALRETRLLLNTEGGGTALFGMLALGGYVAYNHYSKKGSSSRSTAS